MKVRFGDWMSLKRAVLLQPPTCGGPLECEEDWDDLRARDSSYVALFEDDVQVPGTLRRFVFLPSYVLGVTACRAASPTHIGHWKLGETPKLVPLKKPVSIGPITGSDFLYVHGGEVGFTTFWTSTIVTTGWSGSNLFVGPINITAGGNYSSGNTNTSTVTWTSFAW